MTSLLMGWPDTSNMRVGNLVGCLAWCDECERETDHNGAWHRQHGGPPQPPPSLRLV